jgi:hypothetical protein
LTAFDSSPEQNNTVYIGKKVALKCNKVIIKSDY